MMATVALCGAAGLVTLAASAGAVRPTSLTFTLPPYPVEHFSWKNESPSDIDKPACDTNGCAFRDQYFTVDDWDQLCLQHCGDIDALLNTVQERQQGGVQAAQLASRGRTQALVGLEEAPEGMERTSGPELLANAGVNTDTWGLEEREMPEQEPEEEEDKPEDENIFVTFKNSAVRSWNAYWDTGKKLHDSGVNVYGNVYGPEEVHSTDGAPMRDDGVVLDSWPWNSGAREEREGQLPDVHVDGWDGDAFGRK